MGSNYMKENETFQQDYDKMFAKGTWSPQEISMMKDLKKLIYYNLAICAMEEGEGHPGAGHLPEMSYARGRNARGQYTSGNGEDWDRGSGTYPYYPEAGGMYYDGMNNRSGRRYYDSEKEKAIHKLHHMMDNTDDPERKNALKIALNELEMR